MTTASTGMAASVACLRRASPREVYERHLDELQALMRCGVGKVPGATIPYVNQGEPRGGGPGGRSATPAASPSPPPWLAQAGPNLARKARVTVSSAPETADRINDGRADLGNNDQRWLSAASMPVTVEFAWDAPQTFGAMRILSGHRDAAGALLGAIESWTLQVPDGAGWRDVSGACAVGNTRADWSAVFPPETASRARLAITAARGGIARIWEIEFYQKGP